MTAAPTMTGSRLTVLRHAGDVSVEVSGDASGDATLLGGFSFGPRPMPRLMALDLPLLAGGARCERWCSDAAPGALLAGRHADWHWRDDGHWLWAECRLRGDDLEALTRQAYQQLFGLLDARAEPQRPLHLQRLWNYLRDINGEAHGLERYRHFNSGRQQAFIDARRSAFEGAPAACALGLPADAADDLCLAVLAARAPCTAVENPRQVSAYDYPRNYGPRAPSFSRAARVRLDDAHDALLISGTASIVGHASVHTGDVVAQAREILVNLQALLQAAAAPGRRGFRLDDLIGTVYLRRAEDLAAVRGVIETALGGGSATARQAVYLQADICRQDLLVEIEAHCPR